MISHFYDSQLITVELFINLFHLSVLFSVLLLHSYAFHLNSNRTFFKVDVDFGELFELGATLDNAHAIDLRNQATEMRLQCI